MPTYKYRREDGTTFTIRQKITADALDVCPDTGQRVERVITGGAGFHLKGGGWYKDGYASSGATESEKSSSGSESDGSESGGSEANSSESKSAEKGAKQKTKDASDGAKKSEAPAKKSA